MVALLQQEFLEGDVVRVLSQTRGRDFEGNEVLLPEGSSGGVVGLPDGSNELEIEFVVGNDLAVAFVAVDRVELTWRERE